MPIPQDWTHQIFSKLILCLVFIRSGKYKDVTQDIIQS